MELYQLRTFVTVLRLRHLTRAAEQLHLSQPAVSHQIKALEEELGARLFERVSSGLQPTPAGREFLPLAERVVAAADELLAHARNRRGALSGLVRLGTIIDPAFTRLGELLRLLLERHPLLQVEARQSISGLVLDAVRRGEMDIGYYLSPAPEAEVAAVALAPVRYAVTAPAAWREKIAAADWRGIAALPWIGTAPATSQTRLTREMFATQGLQPSQVIQADHERSMRSLVAAGVGLCLIREELAREAEAAGEVVIWPGHVARTTLWLIHLPARTDDPSIAAVLTAARKVWMAPA